MAASDSWGWPFDRCVEILGSGSPDSIKCLAGKNNDELLVLVSPELLLTVVNTDSPPWDENDDWK